MKQKEKCYFVYKTSQDAKFLRVPVARQITKTKTFFLQCLTFKNLLFRSLTVRQKNVHSITSPYGNLRKLYGIV